MMTNRDCNPNSLYKIQSVFPIFWSCVNTINIDSNSLVGRVFNKQNKVRKMKKSCSLSSTPVLRMAHTQNKAIIPCILGVCAIFANGTQIVSWEPLLLYSTCRKKHSSSYPSPSIWEHVSESDSLPPQHFSLTQSEQKEITH